MKLTPTDTLNLTSIRANLMRQKARGADTRYFEAEILIGIIDRFLKLRRQP